jgi:anaerobic selenocysteine-containing dehydrogenase
MRRFGAFEVEKKSYQRHESPIHVTSASELHTDPATQVIYEGNQAVGIEVRGKPCVGFPTPSRKQELYSPTVAEWGWPEFVLPTYIRTHVHPSSIDRAQNEFVLTPTYRLPTLIHSRSGNAKWLAEISNRNPLLMHPSDAAHVGVKSGDLVRVTTRIGYFVDRVWTTEGLKPGIVACSHHLGRWRRPSDPPANRWATNVVSLEAVRPGVWRMKSVDDIGPYPSADPDSSRIFWSDGGVSQNLTFPVQPDPISGMHCWHQKVRVEKAASGDRYGDVEVDTNQSFAVFEEWLAMTRAPRRADRLRRPLWFNRPLRPAAEAYIAPPDSAVDTTATRG